MNRIYEAIDKAFENTSFSLEENVAMSSPGIEKAEEALNIFTQSTKTLEDYSKCLDVLSQLEWDNEIDRAEYEEYLEQAKEILSSREV